MTHFSHGMMLTNSNTFPVPSAFLAQTGCVNGWNESAQQSNGVRAPGCGASDFLQTKWIIVSLKNQAELTPCNLWMKNVSHEDQHARRV